MSIEKLDIFASNDRKSEPSSLAGKLLIGLTGGFAVGLTVICVPFVSPALRKICLPYIPATTAQLKNTFDALKGRSGTLVDLGSGDGRIVLEAAKRNFVSHGVELNPWLVLYAKIDALIKGHRGRTKYFRKDLWKFDISRYDNVVIFGVEQMMSDLERKILKECKENCNVVACRFPLPSFRPVKTFGAGVDTVWIYEIPDRGEFKVM